MTSIIKKSPIIILMVRVMVVAGFGQEIILQKVYISSSRDRKLIDFYLVDLAIGEVLDEHRNTW